MKRHRLEVRLTEDELAWLQELARTGHRSMQGQVRAMIAAHHMARLTARKNVPVGLYVPESALVEVPA